MTLYGGFEPLPAELVEVMTPAERQAYERALKRATALQSPLDFALLVSPGTREFRHIRLLNVLIVALTEHRLYKAGPCEHTGCYVDGEVFDDEDPRMEPQFHPDTPCHVAVGAPLLEKLFITMPPRHGKSYLISEHTPAWFIARHPDRRVIFASYEAEFAGTFGGRGRDIFNDFGDLFGLELDPSSKAQDKWNLRRRRGGMTTAGAGGSITGKGGGLLVCDDPIKNQEEALSELIREKHWNWWHATFKTRREPGAVIALVHTRWHEDDLGGRLMREEGDEWFHIDLPALQPDDEDELADAGVHSGAGNPLGRAPGDALCPERYTAPYLLRERASNPAWFDALYQQRPSTEGSGIFRRQDFRYWEPAGSVREPVYRLIGKEGPDRLVRAAECYHFQTTDWAHSTKTWADYTVISTWALTPEKELLLVARLRKRVDSAEHERVFLENLADLRRAGIKVRVAGVENKTFGSTLISHLRRSREVPFRKLEADIDKTTRAIPAGAVCTEGGLYWPKKAEWLKDWEDEHIQFPVGTHDDQVDTTSYAVYMLYHGGLMWKTRPKEPRPTTMQEYVDQRFRKRPRKVHPELGRL